MAEEVDAIEDRAAVLPYFKHARATFTTCFGKPSLEPIDVQVRECGDFRHLNFSNWLSSQYLYTYLDKALSAATPRKEYVCPDTKMRAVFAVIRHLPAGWSEAARIKMMSQAFKAKEK